MSADTEIARLKSIMGVRSDSALAGALHINKGTVSMWKRRGRVSSYVMQRAEMMAQHGQLATHDSVERIASDIALLHHRLADTRINAAKLAADLEQLAARVRGLGGDA